MPRRSVLIFAFLWLFCASCPQDHYYGNFLNVTHYKIDRSDGVMSPGGIVVIRADTPVTPAFLDLVDLYVDTLDYCLQDNGWPPIHRAWVGVYVPADWYTSSCSGEQLVPSEVQYRLCEDKGLWLPEECREVHAPTPQCPCVCNVRAAIQDDRWIVTAPNLKLLKNEMSRLTTNVNAPWSDPTISPCLTAPVVTPAIN